MAVKRDKIVKNAEKYVGKGKIEAAIKEYQKLLKDQPNDTNTLNRIGDLYTRIDRDDEAIRFFKQIASQYTSDGFFVKAIAIYKKIIRIDPTRLAVYEQLGDLYAKQGLMNEARAQLQTLVDYYLKNGDDAAAINVYHSLVELEPDNPSHHLKLAEVYEKRQLYDQAQREYKTIAEIMLRHDRGEEAAKVFERAIEMHPDDVGFVHEAVRDLRDAGFPEPADRVLARAVELNPEAERIQRLVGSEPARESAPPTTAPEAFDLGEIEIEEAEDVLGPPPSPDEDVFELDVDADLTGTVAPPDDMDEGVGTAFEPSAEEIFEDEGFEGEEAVEAEPGFPEDEIELGDEIEIELDLEEPAPIEWDLEGAEAATLEPEAEPEAEVEAEVELVELPTAEEQVEEEERVRPEDLLDEADVFAKYGLGAKALERIEQALQVDPANLEALRRRVELLSENGDEAAVDSAATAYRRAALTDGEEAAWRETAELLRSRGFEIAEGGEEPVISGPSAIEPTEESTAPPPAVEPAAPPRPGRKKADLDQALEDIASEILRPKKTRPKPAEPRADAAPLEAETVELGPAAGGEEVPVAPPEKVRFDDEDFDMELPDIRLPEERVAGPAAEELDDTGMQWLDEPSPAAGASGEEILFDDEEEFFDLAAELEEELTQEEARLGKDVIAQPEEPSLEEIVEGFKRGVAENLSTEDFATHYNLGIAYREMGLVDEAIGEFQLASKSPELLVDCCSMLGLCFLEKGLPDLALKWYQKGLESPGLKEDTRLGLLYDMGSAHLSSGENDAAREVFKEIYGTNSNFRDVAEKLEELG